MDYAIISFRKNQYLVTPGEKITTLGETGAVGDVITDVETLLVKNDSVEIGTPTVDFPISLKVVEISKTDKVEIFKYRGKSRYRRHTGHRQALTVLEVAEAKPVVKKEKVVKPAKKTAVK